MILTVLVAVVDISGMDMLSLSLSGYLLMDLILALRFNSNCLGLLLSIDLVWVCFVFWVISQRIWFWHSDSSLTMLGSSTKMIRI
jgi:hypothetical protein